MDTSSAAAECVTLMAAAGYVVHTFPTGQGNVIGNPIVPVIKITGNPRTVRTMSEHIDVDVSGILRREMTIPQAGDALIEMIRRTANGTADRRRSAGSPRIRADQALSQRLSAARCRRFPCATPKRWSRATLERCRTAPDNARCVARALVRGRGGRPQGPWPVAAAELCRAGEGRQGRRLRRAARRPAAPRRRGDRCRATALPIPAHRTRRDDLAGDGAQRRHRLRGRSRARIIAAPPAIRSSGWREAGLVAHAVRQHAGRDRAVGRRHARCSAPTPSRSPARCRTRAPIVVDLSLSKVARGNILAARQKGERIPEGWALDAGRQADHRSAKRRSPAPWCRSATPRAPRWR